MRADDKQQTEDEQQQRAEDVLLCSSPLQGFERLGKAPG